MKSEMIEQLVKEGFLKTNEIIQAFKKVDRRLFMAEKYEKYAYLDGPFPIPPFDGNHTISAPHTYAIYYESLELKKGDFFLEIGSGSGYGLALAREIVGSSGKVVGVEINKQTFDFCKRNITKAGYDDIVILNADGKKIITDFMPYDKISVTASAKKIPEILIEQLKFGGKMLIPLGSGMVQELTLVEKKDKITKKTINFVRYVPLV